MLCRVTANRWRQWVRQVLQLGPRQRRARPRPLRSPRVELLETRSLLAAAITGITPNTGLSSGGSSVTVTGSGFSGVTGVTFGGVAATSYQVLSTSSLTAVAPPHAPGNTEIQVLSSQGNSPLKPALDTFTYLLARPAISSLSSSAGPTTGGGSLVIQGANFYSVSAISFGGTFATSFTVNSPTQITATIPAHAAGTVDITITNSAGSSPLDPAHDQYTWQAAGPAVSSVSPNSGTASGGTTVTILGTGFTGVSQVKFGGTSATSFTVNSATSISAVAPAHTAGLVDIQVVTPTGTSTAVSADQFT